MHTLKNKINFINNTINKSYNLSITIMNDVIILIDKSKSPNNVILELNLEDIDSILSAAKYKVQEDKEDKSIEKDDKQELKYALITPLLDFLGNWGVSIKDR